MSAATTRTVADALAERLYAAGVRHAFGVPGGEVLTLMDALERAGIRFVLVRHETAGGFMAEGVWHATGAPGLLVATVGPGVANTINVVANAAQDRVPLVVLTGCVDRALTAGYTHQIFDHRAVLGPITKLSLEVDAQAAPKQIDKALRVAQEGRPGPVHLDLPVEVALAPCASPLRVTPLTAPASPVGSDVFADARAKLAGAERPLLLVGLELARDAAAVRRAVSQLPGLPVLTTYKAKGALAEDHPLCLGAAGLSPKADALLQPFVARADVVVLAGYDPIEMRRSWCDPFGEGATVIELARTPNDHDVHAATHAFACDPAVGLDALTRDLAFASSTWPTGEPARLRAALHAAFEPPSEEHAGRLSPGRAIDAIARATPAHARVTVDTGAHRILLSQQWRFQQAHRLLQSSGLCTMACALPLAIGAKLADPDTPVVCVLGDGGLEMALGDLATLRDLGLGLVVVVLDDQSLALIEKKQRARGLPNVGVDFGAAREPEVLTQYAQIAHAFGGEGVLTSHAEGLREAVEEGLANADRFTLIHVPVPRRAYDGAI
ncbi:MAG: thiamine pyrophosphate-binding protein [Myxococcota bacterium]